MFHVFNIGVNISLSVFLEREKFIGHKTKFPLLITVFWEGLQQLVKRAIYVKNYILNLQYVFISQFLLKHILMLSYRRHDLL